MSDSADARASANRGFFQALIGDGRALLIFTALVLILCGGLAIFQSATGHFLPHGVQYLGVTAKHLCRLRQCRLVPFLFRDRVSFRPSVHASWKTPFGIGRACLLITASALIAGGLTIMTVGSTTVFVPTDLQFMGLSAADLRAINPHLIPLIAHDRAGFGGGLCCV